MPSRRKLLIICVASSWCCFCLLEAAVVSGTSDNDQSINLLVTVKNVRQTNRRLAHLALMIDSVLSWAVRRPLHWVFLIDPEDVSMVNVLVHRIISSKAKIPVQVDYVNLTAITSKFEPQINLSRRYFLNTNPLDSSKFYDEVFHIGLVYHLIFPFRRLIALDMDLKFVVDVADLAQQFDLMDSQNVIAIGNDLAPHYWYDFRHFKLKNPATPVGQCRPGLQGFNTGVLLLDLDRMRRNRLYNWYLLKEERLQWLLEKYEFNGTLAYQDFFTLLGMEHPELFRQLDCGWNRQLDESSAIDEKLSNMFTACHRCDERVRIYHANGGSDMPPDDDHRTS